MSDRKTLTLKNKKKPLPINLARQSTREKRNRNNGVGKNQKRNRRRRLLKKETKDFQSTELDALVHASELQLKEILENEELLSDIPFDVTPDELMGEISLAQGGGTTLYIERDGLSTLTVVLPQEQPTIAHLKRAIAAQARVQLRRELRERHEERQKRRMQTGLQNREQQIKGDDGNINKESQERRQQRRQQQDVKSVKMCESDVEYNKSIRFTGELVCSTTRSGHQHRPNVSWRFLWRSYALYNLATKSIIKDENGRKSLSECGIENAQTLKFCKRENYLGKQRQ